MAARGNCQHGIYSHMHTVSEDEERELKQELLKMDVNLRKKQVAWETPRNIAILAGAVAALSGGLAAWIGYKVGSTPPAPIVIQLPPPAK